MNSELLGHEVTDRVSGFTGVVTGYVQYISGCNQVLVIPKVGKDAAFKGGEWFDVQRVKKVAGSKAIVLDNTKTPGADKAPARRI